MVLVAVMRRWWWWPEVELLGRCGNAAGSGQDRAGLPQGWAQRALTTTSFRWTSVRVSAVQSSFGRTFRATLHSKYKTLMHTMTDVLTRPRGQGKV